MQQAWLCPYCNQMATITENNVSDNTHKFKNANKHEVEAHLVTQVIVCPNEKCREYTIEASLFLTEWVNDGLSRARYKAIQPAAKTWPLLPKSRSKVLPVYIPLPLRTDYEEACAILADSPKASATLARRCLQGMIRDFWNISKDRLIDEIKAIEGLVGPSTWAAIDAVRSIGNIGAHMEKDINTIVEVELQEAEIMIVLLETLFKEWYVNRFDREKQMQALIEIAKKKQVQKVKAQTAS